MKKLMLTFSLFLLANSALAGPKCTNEPRENWKPAWEVLEIAMKEVPKLKMLKVTKGKCYEIYGWSTSGEKLEIYYHPVTAEVKKRSNW
jgi:hypothetical protein